MDDTRYTPPRATVDDFDPAAEVAVPDAVPKKIRHAWIACVIGTFEYHKLRKA